MKTWDVVVIGAGPAGILCTEQLLQAGLNVCMLEAGPAKPDPTLDVERDQRWRYRGLGVPAYWPRVHAFGGRTHLWGGWATRFSPTAFKEGDWPYSARQLEPYYRAVEQRLRVTTQPLSTLFRQTAKELGLHVTPRRLAWASMQPWTGADSPAKRAAKFNTTVLRISEQTLETTCGRTLRAKAFVIAASPVETYRLLVQSNVSHRLLGKRLVDHFNVAYALLHPRSMPGSEGSAALIPRFVNVNAETRRPYPGGFCLEWIGPFPIELVDATTRIMLRDHPSGTSLIMLNALGEQWHHKQRHVDLAPRARDALGRRIPQIHLAFSPAERRMVSDMKATCQNVAQALASDASELVRIRDPLVASPIFHPAGTCAMGVDARYPCDPWGKLRALDNVWIADASVFPSSGDAHPTLTVLAHAMRVAESVQKALSTQPKGSRRASH